MEDSWYIFLIVYASATTFTIILLLCYIGILKRVFKCEKFCKKADKLEDLEKLNRISVPNRYEVDSSSQESRSKLSRSQSASSPRKRVVISQYDSITSSSKKRSLENVQAPLIHQYEELNSLPKNDFQQCEMVLDEVVNSLSEVFTGASKTEDLREKFLKTLTSKLRQKNPKLYNSLRNAESMKHGYEEIQHEKRAKIIDCDSEGDNDYQTFVSVFKKNLFGEPKSITSLGSQDHLKYLVESKSSQNKSELETPYLEAISFSAKSNCPEPLRQLCEKQTPISTAANVSQVRVLRGNQTEQFIPEYKACLSHNAYDRLDDVMSKSAVNRNESFRLRAQQVATALGKSPKSRAQPSSHDIHQ